MFAVEWLQSAVDELTHCWIQSDTPTRTMMTAAAAEIDRKLAANPQSTGESRAADIRVDFIYPLAVTYQVSISTNTVTILHIRAYRRRQGQ